jgi:hypothetical protein
MENSGFGVRMMEEETISSERMETMNKKAKKGGLTRQR